MNPLFHFLFNYLVVDFAFGNAWKYVVLIFLASVLIDLTHIPYLLKVRGGVVKRRFGAEARTRFHEMYGLSVFSALFCAAYIFFDPSAVSIGAVCVILHFAIDFITGKSMPFYPYSDKVVFLHISPYTYRNKVVFEISLTIVAGVLFCLKTASLAL